MKYWEVVKSLTENPALSGVAVIGSIRYELYVDDSRTLQSATHYLEVGLNGTSIGRAANIDFDGWEIVKQPVHWTEAIQEWSEGTKVVWEDDTNRRVFDRGNRRLSAKHQSHMIDQDGDAVTVRMIFGGKWYVED